MGRYRKIVIWLAALSCAAGLLSSCANRGSGPQGGPKDEDPPLLKVATPANGTLNVPLAPITINFEFDENISIEDSYNNVVFSPPQKNRPEIKSNGKKLKVVFADSLKPNTTYTIDFGNAIVDYNESNVLKDFTYSFSTGSSIDSLRISGYVIDAHTLAPVSGVSVGIYSNMQDSVFEKLPFERMAKTREDGSFVIYGVREGEYKLYAVNDLLQDFRYSQFGSAIAFCDSIIRPDVHFHGTIDTLSRDTLNAENNVLRITSFPEYYPQNIILKTFSEERQSEYLKRGVRPTKQSFTLIFGAKPSVEPVITLLSKDSTVVENAGNWFLKERSTKADSVAYWICDSTVLANDTMYIKVDYMKSDNDYVLQAVSDTMRLAVPTRRSRRNSKKQENEQEKTGPSFMDIASNVRSEMQVYDTLRFTFSEPLAKINTDGFHLQRLVNDSVTENVPLTFVIDDSLCTRNIRLFYKKDYGSNYKVTLDSASMQSIYGKINTIYYKTYRIKPLEDYSNLNVKLTSSLPNAVVELLDKSEKVVQSSVYDADMGAFPFQDITPGDYYLRLYIDENQNGKWDTGTLQDRKQAETVYYYPKILNLRANWDVEEEWPVSEIPIMQQRPEALKSKK